MWVIILCQKFLRVSEQLLVTYFNTSHAQLFYQEHPLVIAHVVYLDFTKHEKCVVHACCLRRHIFSLLWEGTRLEIVEDWQGVWWWFSFVNIILQHLAPLCYVVRASWYLEHEVAITSTLRRWLCKKSLAFSFSRFLLLNFSYSSISLSTSGQ